MSTSDPLIGKRLGDYLIEGVLGTGGMARVYRGYDDNLDRYAAIKVIEPQLIASAEEDEYRERFLREARAIARLNHPFIVGVYQFNQVGNLYYIAMEYIDGRNLRDILKSYLRQDKLMPTGELLSVLKDIGDSLDYAHSQNIIHRDVKPSNVLVKEDGHAILTDFGLALNAMEGTIGNTFGSVHYIAPEQAISSAQAVAQSDQYSLGIVAYELLTGRVPFDDASAMSVALKHISDPPPPPTELNPNIPVEVEKALLKALDKETGRRYPSCKEFVKALELAFAMVDNRNVALPPHLAEAKSPPPTPTGLEAREMIENFNRGSKTTRDLRRTTATIQVFDGDNRPVTSSNRSMLVPPEPHSAFNRGILIGVGTAVILVAVVIGLFLSGALNGVLGFSQATQTAQFMSAQTDEANLQTAIELQTDVAASATSLSIAVESTQSAFSSNLTSTAQAVAALPSPTATDLAPSTATPSPTERPIDTDTPTATSTNTASPTATETATATNTATPTASSTNTPTLTPSHTPTATNTPRPTRTPTPSLALLGEGDERETAQVLLRYDGRMIIIGNRDNVSINIQDLVFVLFEANEEGAMRRTNSLALRNSTTFSTRAREMTPTRCFLILDSAQFSSPPEDLPLVEDLCGGFPFWTTEPRPFWISATEGAYFEVRLGAVDVITTCPANRPQTRQELRCAIDVNAVP